MSDEPALARWSRRKQAAALTTEPSADDAQAVAVVDAPEEAEPVAPLPDLPDVESLTADSDYTAFMQAGVPEDLKRLALRKLWRSNPIFANLDGMNDYDEDFGLLYKVGAVIQTSYQVGKGMPDPFPEESPEEEAPASVADADGPVRPSAASPDEDASPAVDQAPQSAEIALKKPDSATQDWSMDGEEDEV